MIRGHYDFVGLPIGAALSFKYVYILSKQNQGCLRTVGHSVPAQFQRAGAEPRGFRLLTCEVSLRSVAGPECDEQGAEPEAIGTIDRHHVVLDDHVFPGQAAEYAGKGLHQRDAENKAISLGLIEYKYERDGTIYSGCRVDKSKALYWRSDETLNLVVKVQPQDWVLDNFVRTTQTYWSIPKVFEVKLLLKGHNDATFPKSTRDLLRDGDHLTVDFATKFLRGTSTRCTSRTCSR